ncbi:MAG: O-antigen ligase family protein [Candidatus Omnitrophica bacterium]|nr:O-antigen ligase family protein [Candidatus Omnitrophota bacterium]
MNKALHICDRLMYGALLVLVIFIPYSLAMIEACLLTIILAWVLKHWLLWKANPQRGFWAAYRFSPSGMEWPLIVIGFLIVATLPWSHAPALSLKKFFSRFLQQAFLMYAVVEIVKTHRRLYGVMATLLLTLFVVNADIFVQYMRGYSFIYHTPLTSGRVLGPMHHPNDLGTLLVMVLPVVLALIITHRYWIPLLWSRATQVSRGLCTMGTVAEVVLFLLLVIALGLTASRGAWIAFAVSMVGLGVCLKRYWSTVLLILMLVVVFWVFWGHSLHQRHDIQDVSLGTQTKYSSISLSPQYEKSLLVFFNPSGRYFYWETAWDIIKRYPLFGCGYSAYVQTLNVLKAGHAEYPHNILLHITAELGLFGLLAHLWFFTALYLCARRVLRAVFSAYDLYILGCGICFGLLAWIIHSLTDTAWTSLQLSILWWLLIGILLSLVSVFHQSTSPRGGS